MNKHEAQSWEERWPVGFVEVVGALGNDATVVNAARVSFGKRIDEIRKQDKKLLGYLADHGHSSPFRHVYVQFHVKAPEFVARQWYKHIVGSEYAFKDMPWNEISGRYVEYDLEPQRPTALRKQSADKKQGSSNEVFEGAEGDALLAAVNEHIDRSFALYRQLVDAGVAKEQARTVLPLTFYTEWYWTASLQAIAHFVKLRSDAHAQLEIQEYAKMLDECMRELFPNAWAALLGEDNE
jgi:thymidylate synthase (FAD)